jgi:D-3-phosphoglycerate dehydrogenase
MAKFRVLVSDKLSEMGLNVFKADPDIQTDVKLKMPPEELKACIGDYDALVIRSDTKVTADVLSAAKKLKVVGRAGVGLDNVDIPAATRAGVIVMNTPDGNTIAAAEHTLALMLSMARNIPQAHMSLKEKKWERAKFMGVEMLGKTLGVIGLGRIGGEVAARARAFGMDILAYDPFCTPDRAAQLEATLTDVPTLLKKADIITVHVPKNKETTNMIGAKELATCKKGARFINVARGGIINEADLAEAIKSGQVAGAAIDVFTEEPPTGNPLLDLPQVVVTPHLGASTEEAQVNVAAVVAKQIVDVLHGRTILNAVNIPAVDAEMWRQMQPYFVLCEKMGSFASQLLPGKISKVSITYSGDVTTHPTHALTLVILKGLMTPSFGDMVNLVNAPVLAKEAGIEVNATKTSEIKDYTNLISLAVEGPGGAHALSGTVSGKKNPLIVEISGYRVDIAPLGSLILFINKDVPGIVGKVGTILGDAGVNISGLTNGRKDKGSEAMSVFSVDGDVSPAILEKIAKIEGLKNVSLIKL